MIKCTYHGILAEKKLNLFGQKEELDRKFAGKNY